jgi:hypothetical protein
MTPTAEQQAQIRQTLGRVLASPAFRNSKQCQKFLTYVVEHSAAGREDHLKERDLGVEVFGRVPDYDTAEDPVVRVRATEIRKRLAQYYQESAVPGDVKMDLPSGSYRAEFHWTAAPLATPTQPAPHPRRWLLPATALALLAALTALWFYRRPPQPTAVDLFWAPVLASAKPVLLYCGQPVVYFLSRDIHETYAAGAVPERAHSAAPVALAPDAVLHGRDIIPVTDQFVGIGNAHTAALLSALFATKSKPVEIRYANDLSFSDLRSSPAVLIGAFSNAWTLQMTAQLRFVFEQDHGIRRIRDRNTKQSWTLPSRAPDGKTPEDYAIVSRLFDSATGQMLITAAGITQYGTRAAGEFLTDPIQIAKAFQSTQPGWSRRNAQVLLHTTVYKDTPAPPKVVAIHVW